jgi:hypothetical protein
VAFSIHPYHSGSRSGFRVVEQDLARTGRQGCASLAGSFGPSGVHATAPCAPNHSDVPFFSTQDCSQVMA